MQTKNLWKDEFTRINNHISSFNQGAGSDYFQFSNDDWDEIKELLLNEIFPSFKVCIINSLADTDDKMEYQYFELDGRWYPPKHHLTILVSGNVLARGITIKGLCTSVLMRDPSIHSADNDMQMQRWFGYRKKIVLSRIVCFEDQKHRLINYHRDDTSARLAYMDADSPREFLDVLVREGLDYRATLRVTGSGNARLQGILPPREQCWTFGLGETGTDFAINAEKIKNFLQEQSEEINYHDRIYGWVRRNIPATEIAEFLEDLRYESHVGDRNSLNVWKTIKMALRQHIRYYRPNKDEQFFLERLQEVKWESEQNVHYSPYRIAAYLRFWSALEHAELRHLPISVWNKETDLPRHWSNLSAAEKSPPNFNFVIRNFSNPQEILTMVCLAAYQIDPNLATHGGVLVEKREIIQGTN